MGKLIDLTGQRFGRWMVLGEAKRKYYVTCQCDCGAIRDVYANNLILGKSVSCGCYCKEQTARATQTHGESKTRLYRIWSTMISRCFIDTQTSFKFYGGRGITVSDEWKNYETFREWSLENGYSDSLSLDRIDSNGDYCPENCRWVTKKEQANNTRGNRVIECFGKAKTLQAWADERGINAGTIAWRIKHGWPVEKAITEPARGWNHASS